MFLPLRLNLLSHFRYFRYIAFFQFLFVLSIPTQASIVQLSCSEDFSYILKNGLRLDGNNQETKKRTMFRENKPSKVWKVSYNLENGIGDINGNAAKIIRHLNPGPYEYAPAYIYSEQCNLTDNIDENIQTYITQLICTNMTMEILTPRNSTSDFIVFRKNRKSIETDDFSEDSNSPPEFYSLEEQNTTEISMGLCNSR